MPKDEKIVEPIAANLDDVVDSIFSAEKQKGKTVASEKGSIGVPLRKTIAGAADRPLKIGNAEIDCYVLDDETRVLSQRGMFRGLGTARGGPRNENEPSNTGAELPRFASQKWISPYITNELALALKSPIRFQPLHFRSLSITHFEGGRNSTISRLHIDKAVRLGVDLEKLGVILCGGFQDFVSLGMNFVPRFSV